MLNEVIMPKHLIWWLLTMGCVLWYLAITWYVAIKGAKDIKEMLSNLAKNKNPIQRQ
jgi:hypothetical protein